MRKFLLLITAALLSFGAYAQSSLWRATISSVREGEVSSVTAMDEDGNVYVAGTQNKKFTFAGKEIGSLSAGAYVAKYNAEGAEQFAISLQGAMKITAIAADADNNIYVAGAFAEDAFIGEVDGEGKTISGAFGDTFVPYPSAFLAKYNANGKLLAVKSWNASMNDVIAEMNSFGMYWGDMPYLSISKLIIEGSNVYAQFNYIGDVLFENNVLLAAKYKFVYEMAYMDANNVAVVTFDNELANATKIVELNVADACAESSSVDSFGFTVENGEVYAAAFCVGDFVCTMSDAAQNFNFTTSEGVTGKGAVLIKTGAEAKVVGFSEIPNEQSAKYNILAGMKVVGGNLYIAGTFNEVCAFDNTKSAVGACDVFVASVNPETFAVNSVTINAYDEGEINDFRESVYGAVFAQDCVYIIDAIYDIDGKAVSSYKNYNVSLNGDINTSNRVFAANSVAYNSNYMAVVNGVDATTVKFYNLPDNTTEIENVVVESECNVIYDLCGRRVNEITKAGIYIVNGKKIAVK